MRSATSKTTGLKPKWFALLGMFAIFAPGCSICCQPYLDDYVAFGSRTPRTNMKFGRVGSPFSDPNAGAPVADSGSYYESQPGEVYYDQSYSGDGHYGAGHYEGATVGETEEIYFEGE